MFIFLYSLYDKMSILQTASARAAHRPVIMGLPASGNVA